MRNHPQGIVIESGDTKAMLFGWGAVALGVGIAVACIVLSSAISLTLTLVGTGLGIGIAAVGVGEGIRRAHQGDAARIEAKARMIAARRELPPGHIDNDIYKERGINERD